jgi:hypothetical protein
MLGGSVNEARLVTTHGIKVALKHDETGQIINMPQETVIRTLADFQKQRTVVLHGSTSRIYNSAALRQLAADYIGSRCVRRPERFPL